MTLLKFVKKIEKEPNFPSCAELVKDFKTKFTSNSYINQSLIDETCITNTEGKTECKLTLSANDPTAKPYDREIIYNAETVLKFPICNGKFHATHEVLSNFPDCTVSKHNTDHCTASCKENEYTPLPSFKSVNEYTTSDHSPSSRTKDRVYGTNELSSPWKPKVKRNHHTVKTNTENKKSYGIKYCYRCGDTSHKVNDCSFDENTRRVDNIKLRNDKWTRKSNSLNCLPAACYDILSVVASVKIPIERWVNMF